MSVIRCKCVVLLADSDSFVSFATINLLTCLPSVFFLDNFNPLWSHYCLTSVAVYLSQVCRKKYGRTLLLLILLSLLMQRQKSLANCVCVGRILCRIATMKVLRTFRPLKSRSARSMTRPTTGTTTAAACWYKSCAVCEIDLVHVD